MTEDLKYAVQQENLDINVQLSETIFNQEPIETEAMGGNNFQESGSGLLQPNQRSRPRKQTVRFSFNRRNEETNYDVTNLVAFLS